MKKFKFIRFIAIANATMFLVLGLHLGSGVQGQKAIAADVCAAPTNPIVAENCLTGNPATEWDINGAGDSSIQGFATDISVNRGETANFKIKTNASSYRLDIYRMGYYGGMGARKVTTVQVLNRPQTQPNCLNDAATGLIDCGNWAVSASWAVPTNAASGIYFAKVVRTDTGGASHIVFIVRDDAGRSDLLFQTADTTWQAYNSYGGNSLYTGSPAGRAYKVSYNRPFNTRVVDGGQDWLFATEYPMVRWLEANGYNVSYFTGVDSDRYGNSIRNHKAFLSLGHDEYWSAAQRANVEAARDNGVNLAFFSGNEIFWKTRWENAIDGSATPYRTLVSYKETKANAKIDPQASIWTGTWRDPRFSPPADGGRPENALTGTLFTVNDGATTAIRVPEADGKLRLWRNTSIANLSPGSTATLSDRTLGYEWDEDIDNGFRPAGLIWLSTTTVNNAPVLQDYGSTYTRATATHHLTLYKHSSGALVFGAGTVQWSWGLDGNHDRGNSIPDVRMQQATVNLFADMGVQPGRLQSGLVPATASTDTIAPTSTISSLPSGTNVQVGNSVTISGTATDIGGVVGGVEVSVDGGTTWHPATGRANWSYTWTPKTSGAAIVRSRAIDDSGNLEAAGASTTVPVGIRTCPCSTWNDTATPAVAAKPDAAAVEVGVKFKSSVNGYITGIRFYKGSSNTGTHIGNLWTSSGQKLATATFTNETASGWQQVSFAQPVAITANTVYVASYHTSVGYYSITEGYFATAGVDSSPLQFLRNGENGGNGVYKYGASGFPTNSYQSSNYWVDVVFSTSAGNPTPPANDTTSPTVTTLSPSNGATNANPGSSITATFSEAIDPVTINANTFFLQDAANSVVPATVTYDAATLTATLQPSNPLTPSTTYRATIVGGTTGMSVRDLAGNPLLTNFTWSFTTATAASASYSLWSSTATPVVAADSDTAAVEVGVKFKSDINGYITGIRFYKGNGNTGTHIGNLWTSSGQKLATATFTNETATGWQQVNFAQPVAITANTIYVASYHTGVGHYSSDENYFATSGVDNGVLHILANGVSGGNGVYKYGTSGFPNQTYRSSNYWVDIVFTPNL